MKLNETLLSLLTDPVFLLESICRDIADQDPEYPTELAIFRQGCQALLQAVPQAEAYLQASRLELASDFGFALWQGFTWSLECFRNPICRLLAQLDFEVLCQESAMHALPAAQEARKEARALARSLPADQQPLLEPIIDHFAYLQTYGYRLAHEAGCQLAKSLVLRFSPGVTER